MNATTLIVGNVTQEPELRFTPSNKAVTNFSVAVNKRIGQGDNAKDEATFYRVTAWESLAENIAASFSKGMRVFVYGEIHNRPYTDKEGNARTVLELKADLAGPELRWQTATTEKVDRGGASKKQPTQAAASFDDEEPF